MVARPNCLVFLSARMRPPRIIAKRPVPPEVGRCISFAGFFVREWLRKWLTSGSLSDKRNRCLTSSSRYVTESCPQPRLIKPQALRRLAESVENVERLGFVGDRLSSF